MKLCHYVYCKKILPKNASKCPYCGYPTEDRATQETDTITSELKRIELPEKLIDMHQIIRSEPDAIEQQLHVMKVLNIEKVLIQAGPMEKGSILGNEQLRHLLHDTELTKKFYISQFLDPRMPQAVQTLEQYSQSGIRMIKLISNLGYYPDNDIFDPFWGAMSDLQQIVMVHTGFITARHKHEEKKAGVFLNSKYSNPVYWDLVARKFPKLTILLCHSGGSLWYEEAAQMITQHDNVYGDISGSGLFAIERFLRNQVAVDYNKLMWGNDSSVSCYPYNLNIVAKLLAQYHLSHYAEDLFYNNAASFCKEYL